MPELPKVEAFRQLVERTCLGHTVARAVVLDPGSLEGVSAATLQRRLKDSRVESGDRHGKVLFVSMDPAGVLAMHFGTNGSLHFLAQGEAEPAYVRIRFAFTDGSALAYVNPRRFGRVSLAESAAAYIAATRLGPDALDPKLDLATFGAMLAGHRQAIKPVLMDQSLLAGIGNLYADDILFQAGIYPGSAANGLSKDAVGALFGSLRRVLRVAVEADAGVKGWIERLPRGFLLPERHPGGRCPRCGTPLAVEKRGGRRGYYCPRCQPGPV